MKTLQLFLSLCTLLLVTTAGNLKAQDICGFDTLHEKRLQEDPEYRARLVNNERKTQAWIAANPIGQRGTASYTIPVVVHVIHLGEAEGTGTNISTAQITSAIDRMNAVYLNNDGVGDGINTGIEFCLADVNPNCQTTSGIIRIDGTSVTNYGTMGIESGGTAADEVETKDLSRWNPEEYLNIWVVSEIDDNGGGSGTQGYSRQPAGAPYDYDGVVVLYNAIGYDPDGSIGYNLKSYTRHNATLIHEVAHYLDVYHTFTGDADGTTCPSNSNCLTDGDFVCDTDPHIRSASDCPGGTNSCSGNSNSMIVDNYMDYSAQSCKDRFTLGQATRMQAALNTSRLALWKSQACAGNTTTPVAATCSPTTSSPHPTAGIGIEDIAISTFITSSGNTYEEGGYLDRSCRSFTVEPNTTYSVSIQCGSSNPENLKIYIDYNNNGDLSDSGEEVFSSTNSASHTGNFTTPMYPATTATPLRLRVISDFVNYAITSPCQTLVYGQAEDFSMTINPLEPAITASVASLSGFKTSVSANSASQSFTVSGDELKDDVGLSLSGTAYELSTDDLSFSSSLTLTHNNYDLAGEPVTVYVRLKSGSSGGNHNETLTLSSTDATNVNISLQGRVIDPDNVRGNSIALDGSGDYVLTTFTGISGAESRSFEAWIKTGTSSAQTAILGYGSDAAFQKWVLLLDAGRLSIEVHTGFKTGTTDLRDNRWHHLAVVMDNSSGGTLDNTTLYVDGIAETISGSANTSTALNTGNGQAMWIGNDHLNRYFDGQIEEVSIWNVARTQTQIRESMHLTLGGFETGLLAYYQMNEPSGASTEDKISGADGSLNGDAAFTASSLAVAGGTCSTVNLGSNGTGGAEVNANNMLIDFVSGSGTMPNGDLVIYRLEEEVFSPPTYDDQSDRYWIVRNFGSNQNSLDVEAMTLTLDLGDAVLAAPAADLSLHKRGSGEDGDWLKMANTANSVNGGSGEVSFTSLTGFNSFSQIIVGQGTALPVEWADFQARRQDEQFVRLQWTTASELNNIGFDVEQSFNGSDFLTLGFVKSKGAANVISSYSFRLEEPKAAYYRLRQRDKNGEENLSPVRYVEGRYKKSSAQVFPNPTSGHFQLYVEGVDPDEVFELSLFDINGQLLLKEKGTVAQLNGRLSSQQDQLPSGLLLLQLKNKEQLLFNMNVSMIRL